MVAGCSEEARAAANGLVDVAEATRNPHVLAFALFAYGFCFRDASPVHARDALRRGLVIAQDSGNRATELQLAIILSGLEADHGDPLAALEYLTLAIRNYHDAGKTPPRSAAPWRSSPSSSTGSDATNQRPPSPVSPSTPSPRRAFPKANTAIAHLREVLGDPAYESLARKGKTMTTAEIVAYAYDEIDQSRIELNRVSE